MELRIRQVDHLDHEVSGVHLLEIFVREADRHTGERLAGRVAHPDEAGIRRVGPAQDRDDRWERDAATELPNGAVNDLHLVINSLKDGDIKIRDFGPLTLGIEDWNIGPFQFDGEIQFGSLNAAGVLQNIPGTNDQVRGPLFAT